MKHLFSHLVAALFAGLPCLAQEVAMPSASKPDANRISRQGEAENPLFVITDAHLDTQWNWDVQTTIEQYLPATLSGNFALLKSYPHYRFNFEGAVKYQWMKEYYPAQYEQLKQYVAEGRWNPSGGSWDANETMVASAESLLRNLLYGQTFYKREFGRKGGTDIMLPDCFGFSAALPSIAAHCGFTGFHSQKLSWGSAYDYGSLPAFGKWRGVDGSEIYCVLKMGAYDANFEENLAQSNTMLSDIRANETACGLRAAFRYTGKSGDRGGAQEEKYVRQLEKSATTDGQVQVKIVSPTEMFDYMRENDRGQYRVVDHELPMRTHGVGCYTSQTMMKYWNRRNELTGDAAERASVAAAWLGGFRYPYETLTAAWQRVIWHQFHDDLPGTCISRAYGYSRNDEVLSLLDFTNTTTHAVASVASRMDTRTEHMPVVVYNPLSIEREDVVEAEVPASEPWTGIRVTAPNGEEVAAQLTRFSEGRQHFIFAARVPSMGYAVYDLEKNAPCTAAPEDLSLSGYTMENVRYRVTIDSSTGDIKSIYDKALSQELLSSSMRLALMPCKSTSWPAWEIPYATVSGSSVYVNNADGTLNISVAEDGPLRKAFRIERTRLGSTFVQYVSLAGAGGSERVEVWNEVDWQSRGYLLKLEANLRAMNRNATYDNSLGFISRGLSTESYYEYAAHQWADQTASTGRYGVSILNDCKYGWDKPSATRLRMTLVYTPTVGDNYTYQGFQDLGLNRFRFAIFGHEGAVGEATQWQSDRLNQPLMAYVSGKHDGELDREFSFVSVDNPAVAVRALKRAEDSDMTIIRFHELTGNAQESVTVTFPADILEAWETNGIEEPTGTVAVDGCRFSFSIGSFAPKTFAVRLATPDSCVTSVSAATEAYAPVTLSYNADVMSLDANRADGAASTLSYLFPGELLPDTLHHDGVPFLIGPREAGKRNALICRGQEVDLPRLDADAGSDASDSESSANADSVRLLHLLAFSLQPGGSELTITSGDETRTLRVGHVMGQVAELGTWFSVSAFRPERVAFTATHSHEPSGRKDIAYKYMYLQHYTVALPRDATTFSLPSQTNVYVVAATLESCDGRRRWLSVDESRGLFTADNAAVGFGVLSSLDAIFPAAREVPSDVSTCGQWLVPASVSASAYTHNAEAPRMAADGQSYTKWCDNKSSTKWLQYTFADEVEACQWEVLGGGIESRSYVPRALRLQYLDAAISKWVDADLVTENTENHLLRPLTSVRSKRFRLQVDEAEQNGGGAARIYQFNLYGNPSPGETDVTLLRSTLSDGPCPVYGVDGCRMGMAVVRAGVVCMPVLPRGIYVVAGRKVRVK